MSADNVPSDSDTPKPVRRRPRFDVPPGACDTHFHVFEHSPRYPFAPSRYYTPARVPHEDFVRMREALGIERAVLVHPTPYGTDNRLLVDVLRDNPNYRGVAVVDLSATDSELRELDRAGVRAARVTASAAALLGRLEELAQRVAPLGWHLQFWLPAAEMFALAPRLRELPVPVVLDHFGGLTAVHAQPCPEQDALLALLAGGRTWVKLSAAYRASLAGPPYADLLPLAGALIAAAPQRMLWGSDWPHSNLKGKPMPDAGDLLGLLGDWAPDEAVRRRILVDNPAALYGF